MDISELIKHPERLDRDTLYELRSMLALYPYFQVVRLLMLQNLYLDSYVQKPTPFPLYLILL